MMNHENLNRREFAALVASGAAVPLSGALVQPPSSQPKPERPQAREPSQADRLLELVQKQYPDGRLDAAALAEIKSELEIQLARGAQLSAVRLANGDEPGFTFAAYRRDVAKG